eukprot:Gregarina_sp_Pseudo_9__2583@NODE_284_length_3295_cov_40_243857_g266_i0_p1_GENE_NODE_284_length_3295_cov_40_243857_g266_i0NODE_284_length_3295_cov_40_243857_g266_i0_p1_ORF_typecomplete_len574_score32_37UNC93/PF05978_16/1_4e13UNC93/PF05978_16/2_4e03MFS_1/PF07690_16/4e08MFS_1/PF07690_16/1_3e03Mid2/PF04478_12/5_3Mid2/PF04478_12/5_2e02Mid2/PF04478_12/1_6e03Wzy_C/PF04932_15/34Wzy_C/PF04932_15/84_NODE_284_length_3295_cov_40_243857_g266_i014863207
MSMHCGDDDLAFDHPLTIPAKALVHPEDPLRHVDQPADSPALPVPWASKAATQIVIYSIFCMCTLGPYNGLNGIGGGGMKDVLLVTKLNAFYSISLAVFGWLGGAAFNYWGCRPVCVAACFTYLLYIVVLTCITLLGAPGVIALPTGVVLGVGAALLWATFGVVSIRYPTPLKQARVFALMWGLVNLGGFLCGLISLMTNLSSQSTDAGLASYLGLIIAVVIGTAVAAFGLRHQDSVIRSDGEPAGNDHANTTLIQTFSHALDAIKDKRLLMLWPAFLIPFAHHPFLFNGMNAQYFNIRSRSMNSSLYWGARIPGGILFYFVCRQRTKYKHLGSTADVKKCLARRLMPGYYLTFAWSALALSCSYFSIFDTFGNLSPPKAPHELLDFHTDYPAALLAMTPFLTFGVLDSLIQSLLYNILGAMAGEDSGRAAVFSGFYKTLQSLMVGGLWTVDWLLMQYSDRSAYPFRYRIQWFVMCVLWLAAFPGTLVTLLRLRKMPETFVLCPSDEGGETRLEAWPSAADELGSSKLAPSPGEVSTIVSSSGGIICLAHMEGNFPMQQPRRMKLSPVSCDSA